MQRVLVTGGAGFIGSHIVQGLQAAGHEVVALDDLSGGSRSNLPTSVPLHVLDIRSDQARQAIEHLQPDSVVHAAAQVSVRISMDEPWVDTDKNVTGLVNVLSALRQRPGSHVVFLSSGGACYGEQDYFPAREDHPIRPESVYGLSKRVGELYLELWGRAWGVTSTALRLSNVFGPRQNPHGEAGVVAIFSERLLRGESIMVNGSGGQTRDFVYVEDVAAAVVRSVELKAQGIFNIGTARETSIMDLAKRLRSLAGSTAAIQHGPSKAGEQQRSCIDTAAARQALGWSPSVDLDQGLARTLAWYKESAR
jgi:UDP-glucose 4-epimerase